MGVPGRVLFYFTCVDLWGRARGQNLGSFNKVGYCSLFIQTTVCSYFCLHIVKVYKTSYFEDSVMYFIHILPDGRKDLKFS